MSASAARAVGVVVPTSTVTGRRAPFNQQLSGISVAFGKLLRAIVETVDRRGLKCRYLRKHERDGQKFFRDLRTAILTDETALTLRKRLLTNEDRLFSFLNYDNVPWNNNNTKHALRVFTKLRNGMATSTAKGTKEYAVLLSIQQTLKYRNMNFLKFRLSADMEIEGLA